MRFAAISFALIAPAVALASDSAISWDTFKERRAALLDSLGGGTAVLYSQGRSGDTGYRADANFWYLTGVDDPGAILILSPDEVDREVLLLDVRDTEAERWTGVRPALSDSLRATWGFDQVRRTTRLGRTVVARMKNDPQLHLVSRLVSPDSPVPPDLELYGDVRARIPGVSLENSARFLESMRMVKSADEITAIERAIEITHRGLTDLFAAVRPGITEFQLDGILEESFKRQGAQHQAFPPIVGAGEQSTVLHYQRRDRALAAGELLLLDVGAEWDRYAADISRTIPVDGVFTPEQAEIYDLVLAAQNAAIAAVKPGATVREVHETARDVFRAAGRLDEFLHGTSHHLGLDVHDYADYARPLAPGMVITVEPGIYLPDRDLGVRIEDDVLVTEDGHRVLSAALPRERSAVESWLTMARRTTDR